MLNGFLSLSGGRACHIIRRGDYTPVLLPGK